MCKPIEFTWTIKGGKKLSNEEINQQVQEGWGKFVEKVEQFKSELEPPKTLTEFEDRLGQYLETLYEQTFGRVYYLTDNKMLRNDISVENLVNIGIECHKFSEKRKNVRIFTINQPQDGYKFLKIALEKNYPFSQIAQTCLGVFIDRSGLTGPQKDEIAVQCAAQVIWNIEGERIPSIEAMISRLRLQEDPIYELLYLKRFSRKRTIRDWIGPIYPIPPELRKQDLSNREGLFYELIPIPGIHQGNTTNFQKLRFATISLTRILKLFGWEREQIIGSRFIDHLASSLRFYPRLYLKDWVVEAYSGNGRIFNS